MPTTFFGWVFFLMEEYGPVLLTGAGVTLLLAVVGTIVGCLIGLVVGIIQTIPMEDNDSAFKKACIKITQRLLDAYVEIFRGTPMIVQAMVVYYGAMSVFNIDMSPMFAGFFVVSINTGAYMAETVRGGIESVDPGQKEAAIAIGMDHFQIMYNVILPQALRNVMPQLGNNLIINIKDTSVMFVIGFIDFFAQHRNIIGVNNMNFPSATIEMIGYLCLTLVASFLLRFVEKKMDGGDGYELVQVDPLVMTAGTYSHPNKGNFFEERNKEYSGKGNN